MISKIYLTWLSGSCSSLVIFNSLIPGTIIRLSLSSRLLCSEASFRFSSFSCLTVSWSLCFGFLSSLLCGVYLIAAASRVQISDCLNRSNDFLNFYILFHFLNRQSGFKRLKSIDQGWHEKKPAQKIPPKKPNKTHLNNPPVSGVLLGFIGFIGIFLKNCPFLNFIMIKSSKKRSTISTVLIFREFTAIRLTHLFFSHEFSKYVAIE